MSLLPENFDVVDNHWALLALGEADRVEGLAQADEQLARMSLKGVLSSPEDSPIDLARLERLATAYELAAIEGLESLIHLARTEQGIKLKIQAQAGAHRAFGILRVLPIPVESVEARIFHVLHVAGVAYCGDRWTDLRRWLNENEEVQLVPSVAATRWDQRLLYRIFDAWLSLLRKRNWDDLDRISQLILTLREEQKLYEATYLEGSTALTGASLALRLVALYHWAKATERLAEYMLQGEPAQIATELDQHFEAACKAALSSQDYQLEVILRWLHGASRIMVNASIWWTAEGARSRTTSFVKLVTQSKGMFELLPPQQAAIQEQGLLNAASQAVVIDMPTSGGKTALAQFRMLQALNQFEQDNGWVAYVAPTRALVSQITRRLREDFTQIGIRVEPLTGAVEIDSFEEDLLQSSSAFQVLVLTPEKLQLVIRNKKVKRPLSLTVLDEAHNIEDKERGLRIELLLATIKQEHPKSKYLLMMPFVPNADDLAQWLGDGRGTSISLSAAAWQPNERIVGIFNTEQFQAEGSKRGDWRLTFETLTTTQNSINLRGKHYVDGVRPLKRLNYSEAQGLSIQAAAMAKAFSSRGTSIAVAQKIPDVWNIARKLSSEMEALPKVPEEIALVQRFLQSEISPDFELVGMLEKGIAVHHAGLPAEALSLIEWLTEKGLIKVLCATTTIAQGLNFPVSSVFLATRKYPYGIEMSHRSFWNLAGRAGRVQHGSVGVVGIAAGDAPNEIIKYVSDATGELISRLIGMLDDIESEGDLLNLQQVLQQDQWADFRSYIAHLWNEKRNLDIVISEAEQLLRNTYGYSVLRGRGDPESKRKADAVLEATKGYVREIAKHPENASLADATGFSPEGVRTAFLELGQLENKIRASDWAPSSLFEGSNSMLPALVGVMMKIPQLKKGLEEIKGNGPGHKKISDITQAWVAGKSIESIAKQYFDGKTATDKISNACKAIYRELANNATWGISALSKMPTSGLDYEAMSDEEKRQINNLPAMLYHGVRSEEAVLMRMNSAPRSIAESLGTEFKRSAASTGSATQAADFLRSLSEMDWDRLRPKSAAMSGSDYREVWRRLSGQH